MKKILLLSILFLSTTVCFASMGWVSVKNQSSTPWEFGYAYEDSDPSKVDLDTEWSVWYDTATDPDAHKYKERIIKIYDRNDKAKLVVELYSAADPRPGSGLGRVHCNFEVVLDKDRHLTARRTSGETYNCTATVYADPTPPEDKQNSLSLKVNGTTAWAPIVKVGDEAVKPDLCAANTNPELADQTQKLCKLWYNTDKSSVDINGAETRNIRIYDRKNQSKLLVDLQTASTSGVEQCKYTVTFNEKAALDSKYQVNVADARCKYTVTP